MWADTFHERLRSWCNLRQQVSGMPLHQCLDTVNQWWMQAPWSSYYLHWDDQAEWPDPWQLLDDNIFCSLARGLGIMYTISLLQRSDLCHTELVETKKDNLVVVDDGIYVLNWDRDTIVNISPEITNRNRRLSISDINHQIL